MGFSVSGSAAIIFAGMFIAFGMFYTATANSFESVSDAQADRTDRELTRQNTAINVTSATWFDGNTTLRITAANVGATTLELEDTDVLANNTYLTGYSTSVEGDSTTGLWVPGETLTVEVTALTENPGHVRLVTGPGVADSTTVEVN